MYVVHSPEHTTGGQAHKENLIEPYLELYLDLYSSPRTVLRHF